MPHHSTPLIPHLALALALASPLLFSQAPPPGLPIATTSKVASQPSADPGAAPADANGVSTPSSAASYVLGPEDSVTIKALDVDELGTAPYPIDLRGNLNIPLAGRIHAAGLTVDQLEAEIAKQLKEYLQDPVVTVTIAEFRSQPISILGQVGTPGVHQMQGRKTLFEVISEAGGLKPEAGNVIKITRQKAYGPIPLPDAQPDSTGDFSVAEIQIRDLMEARNPAFNIPIMPYDVITVPKADLIYVIGSVQKSGGFVLSERANMSVLQALALAEGLQKTAATSKAKIIRQTTPTGTPAEIPLDVKQILDGKIPDVPLLANDILFIPNSAGKSAAFRTLDAIVQAGTMAAVYRPF